MVLALDPLQLMETCDKFGEIVSAAPEHRLGSYTQLNVIAIGFVVADVGMSIGAVALHDIVWVGCVLS